jgi:hypothetical protein
MEVTLKDLPVDVVCYIFELAHLETLPLQEMLEVCLLSKFIAHALLEAHSSEWYWKQVFARLNAIAHRD